MTKKDFIASLILGSNILVAAGSTGSTPMTLDDSFLQKCEETLNDKFQINWRKCIKHASNHITFSDESSIYFDQKGKYKYYELSTDGLKNFFKVKRYIVQELQSRSVEGKPYFSYVIYAIK